MLDIFAKADAAGVRSHRQTVFRGHQEHTQHLVQSAHPAGVDLHQVDGAAGDHLLEDDAVLAHLAGDALHGRDGLADALVSGDVVRARRLLDEAGLREGKLADPVDGVRPVILLTMRVPDCPGQIVQPPSMA